MPSSQTIYCHKCGNKQERSTKFCPYCGQDLQTSGVSKISASENSKVELTGEDVAPNPPKRKSFRRIVIWTVVSIVLIGVGVFAFLANTVKSDYELGRIAGANVDGKKVTCDSLWITVDVDNKYDWMRGCSETSTSK